jgi:NitT/TauT family transport system substrate-binding protein
MSALALAGALVLAGCAAQPAPSGGGDAAGGEKPLEKMVFLSYLPLETLSLAPEMLALTHGFFEEEGLDVQLQPVNGSPVAIQGLIGGVAPITRAGGIDVLTLSSQGQTLVNVGTLERGGGFRVVSSEDNPLEDIDDLPGTTIGVGSEGGTSAKTMMLALETNGHDPDSVERQVVGLTPATFALVQQGQLDGYMLGIDTAVMVGAANDDAVVSPAGLTAATDVQAYVSTPDQIEAHGDQIEKFLRAIKKSAEFIIADEEMDETLESIRTQFSFAALDDDAVAKESLDAYRDVWVGDGSLDILEQDPERWQEGYDLLVKAGLSEPGGDPGEWMTTDLLPAE